MKPDTKTLLHALKLSLDAMMQARLVAATVDEERGDKLNWKGRKCFPANQAVVHATQDAMDKVRALLLEANS